MTAKHVASDSVQVRLDVHMHHDSPDPRIDQIIKLLNRVITKENTIMANIDDLAVDAEAQTTVVDSAVALLNSIAAQLAAAGTDPAKLEALHATLTGNTQELADAVTANTPVDPNA